MSAPVKAVGRGKLCHKAPMRRGTFDMVPNKFLDRPPGTCLPLVPNSAHAPSSSCSSVTTESFGRAHGLMDFGVGPPPKGIKRSPLHGKPSSIVESGWKQIRRTPPANPAIVMSESVRVLGSLAGAVAPFSIRHEDGHRKKPQQQNPDGESPGTLSGFYFLLRDFFAIGNVSGQSYSGRELQDLADYVTRCRSLLEAHDPAAEHLLAPDRRCNLYFRGPRRPRTDLGALIEKIDQELLRL